MSTPTPYTDFLICGLDQLKIPPKNTECPICKVEYTAPVPPSPEVEEATAKGGTPSTFNGDTIKTREAQEAVAEASTASTDNSVTAKTSADDSEAVVRIKACGHCYHFTCLRTWLSDPKKNTCPMCRKVLYQIHSTASGNPGFWTLQDPLGGLALGTFEDRVPIVEQNTTLANQLVWLDEDLVDLFLRDDAPLNNESVPRTGHSPPRNNGA